MNTAIQDALVVTATSLPFPSCRKVLQRKLQHSGFRVLADAQMSLPSEHPGRSVACTALVVWNPVFAYQTLQMDPQAGFMLPFCLVLQEDGNGGSKVFSSNYRQILATGTSMSARVLARVLEYQIQQVLFHLVSSNAYQQAVEEGGGEYRGLQPGSAAKHIPDLVLFDDPATHTTLALPVGRRPITAGAVRRKIGRSRSQFHRQEQTKPPVPADAPAIQTLNSSKGEWYEMAL